MVLDRFKILELDSLLTCHRDKSKKYVTYSILRIIKKDSHGDCLFYWRGK